MTAKSHPRLIRFYTPGAGCIKLLITFLYNRPLKASFHSGKLSVDWNGQENFSLSCELWVGTNDFSTKKNFLVRSNPRIIFLSGN
jgi:hypothetical protein